QKHPGPQTLADLAEKAQTERRDIAVGMKRIHIEAVKGTPQLGRNFVAGVSAEFDARLLHAPAFAADAFTFLRGELGEECLEAGIPRIVPMILAAKADAVACGDEGAGDIRLHEKPMGRAQLPALDERLRLRGKLADSRR